MQMVWLLIWRSSGKGSFKTTPFQCKLIGPQKRMTEGVVYALTFDQFKASLGKFWPSYSPSYPEAPLPTKVFFDNLIRVNCPTVLTQAKGSRRFQYVWLARKPQASSGPCSDVRFIFRWQAEVYAVRLLSMPTLLFLRQAAFGTRLQGLKRETNA